MPVAPGTAGSAVAAVILGLVPFSRRMLVLTFVAVIVVGTWAAHHTERLLGAKDPGRIVVDEAAGMMLSVLLLPLTAAVLAAAFVLFRIFDIVKPFPAYASQRLPGGIGVMADDLVAGLYALGVLALARGVVGWP